MSTPNSRILAALLEQHDTLRAIMNRCAELAAETNGAGDVGQLARELAKLRLALRTHNDFEEQLLRPVLEELDAFGGVRVERMCADHIAEHDALQRRLAYAPLAELEDTLNEIRAHLAAEERYFLSSRVLRDDIVTLEGAG